MNRWDKALAKAREFQKEQGRLPPIVRDAITIGVPSTVAAWSLWNWIAVHPIVAAVIGAGLVFVAVAAWRFIKSRLDERHDKPIAPTPAIIESEERKTQ